MKQLAQYKVHFDGKAIRASVALMGLAFFFHALYFFVMTRIQDARGVHIAFFLIIPMLLELGWIIFLRCVKLNAAGVYGILIGVFCILLAIQTFFTGTTLHIVLALIAYLLLAALAVFITGGFFPYKYIGLGAIALVGIVRLFYNDVFGLIRQDHWAELVWELPGLCVLFALLIFFGGIEGVRRKK